MDEGLRRRLRILVALLIAAFVLGKLAGTSASLPPVPQAVRSSLGLPYTSGWGTVAVMVSGGLALATMLALVPVLRLRPGTAEANPWRRPGWLACHIAAMTTAVVVVMQLSGIAVAYARRPESLEFQQYMQMYLTSLFHQVAGQSAIAVAAAWATLALTEGWEGGPGVMEWLGVLCGIYLLAFQFFGLVAAFLGLVMGGRF